MRSLLETLGPHLEQGSEVERAVFRTEDPTVAAAHLDRFCAERLGAPVEECLFYCSSTGCVAGVGLADGRLVVVKAYQDRWGAGFLGAVAAVQGHLARSGFPCPRPLVVASPAGPALATAEEYVADPGASVLATASERRASASGLARLVALCRPLQQPELSAHPLRSAPGRLYPEPHSPLFDFGLDTGGAGWIDELARLAMAARQADHRGEVIGHADWSARNIRLARAELVVAYDWDSLSLATESVLVGQAAATWRSFGEEGDRVAPDIDEVRAYVADYEEASARAFDPGQRRAAMASALWVLAYTARCEHALEAATGTRVEHARARLRAEGRSFLESPDG